MDGAVARTDGEDIDFLMRQVIQDSGQLREILKHGDFNGGTLCQHLAKALPFAAPPAGQRIDDQADRHFGFTGPRIQDARWPLRPLIMSAWAS